MRAIVGGLSSGLHSRFAFYAFNGGVEWKSHRPGDHSTERDRFFNEAAAHIDDLCRILEQRDTPLIIRLREKHWNWIDKHFEAELTNLIESGVNPLLEASVKRLAIIAFRIICILTVLRAFEKRRKLAEVQELVSTDNDTRIGISLALTYLAHAITATSHMAHLPVPSKDRRRSEFMKVLPAGEFTTSSATELADSLEPPISQRTVMRYLDSLVVDGVLKRSKHGVYEKAEGSK
jgi:hypothetical protein